MNSDNYLKEFNPPIDFATTFPIYSIDTPSPVSSIISQQVTTPSFFQQPSPTKMSDWRSNNSYNPYAGVTAYAQNLRNQQPPAQENRITPGPPSDTGSQQSIPQRSPTPEQQFGQTLEQDMITVFRQLSTAINKMNKSNHGEKGRET